MSGGGESKIDALIDFPVESLDMAKYYYFLFYFLFIYLQNRYVMDHRSPNECINEIKNPLLTLFEKT